MKTFVALVAIPVGLVLLGWLGLQVKPRPFQALAQNVSTHATMPIPAGLPAPVERFYRQTYGENLPVIHTAVLIGRGWMKPFGFRIPMRFRFTFDGENYHSRIEATFFGFKLFDAVETYIDGRGYGRTPGGIDQGGMIDKAVNIRMWAEALTWLPALLLNDPRVQWEPLDDLSALLVVPFGEQQDHLVVRFDPETGKVLFFETMRYKSQTGKMTLWVNGAWVEDGKPWINVQVEEMIYNLDVQAAIRSKD
jgi:hypothetical protein